MNAWLEISRLLQAAVMVLLFFLPLALILYDGLRSCVRDLKWRLSARRRSPETEAVNAIAHHQGAFNLHTPSAVRQKFAHRYELTLRTHWVCAGKWKPDR